MDLEEITLIRHIEVEHNANKDGNDVLCGRHDTEPTKDGLDKAKRLNREIKENKDLPESLRRPDIIISSYIGRAVRTAEEVYKDAEVEQSDFETSCPHNFHSNTKNAKIVKSYLAAERTYGIWDGRSASEVMREYNLTSEALKEFRNTFTDENARAIPKSDFAENLFDVEERAIKLWNKIKALDCKNVVVISHVAFLKIFDGVIRGLSREEMVKTVIKNCTPVTFRKGENGIFTRVNPTIE